MAQLNKKDEEKDLKDHPDPKRRSAVHIIWEVESCPIPISSTAVATVQALSRFGGQYGQVLTFCCICRQGYLLPLVKRDLQDWGVVVEEVFSDDTDGVHVFTVTQIMSVALEALKPSKLHSPEAFKTSAPQGEFPSLPPPSGSLKLAPSMVLVTNSRHFTRALGVVRRSGLFSSVVVIHRKDAPESLIHSASASHEWFSLLSVPEERTSPPLGPTPAAASVSASSASSSTSTTETLPLAPAPAPAPVAPTTTAAATSVHELTSSTPDIATRWPQPEFSSRGIGSYPSIIDDAHLLPTTNWAGHPATTDPAGLSPEEGSESIFSLQAMSDQAATFARRTAMERDTALRSDPLHMAAHQETPPSPLGVDGLASREIQEFRSFLSKRLEQSFDDPIASSASPPRGDYPFSTESKRRDSRSEGRNDGGSTPSSWGSSPHIEPLALPSPLDCRTFAPSGKSVSVWPMPSDRKGTPSPQSSPQLKPGAPGFLPMSTPATIMSARRRKRRNSKGKMSKLQRNAVALFDQVMDECMEEKIIPRESVVRSRIEPNLLPKARKLKTGIKVPLRFEHWVNIIQEAEVCAIEGAKPQRIIWPAEGRFDCADYFRPVERLTPEDTKELVDFFEKDRPQVDRGRYGLATYLKYRGPTVVRKMPRGYIVELVQLLLNKHILVFRKGKVSYAPMGLSHGGLSSSDGLVSNGVNEGPPLPKPIRRALSRHLSANSEYAGQVTDDPVGVLHFLTYSACQPNSKPGSRIQKIPMYHFEKSGLLHAPMWVCVVTLEAAGLRDFRGQAQPPTIQKFKRFRSSQKGRKGESQQEVALHVLENYYWRLAFNICIAEIAHEARIRAARVEMSKTVEGKDSLDVDFDDEKDEDLSMAMYPCFQPGSLRPAHLDSAVVAEETAEREATVKIALRRSALKDLRQQDSVLRLDRLVFAMDQKPIVYEVNTPGAKEGEWTAHTSTSPSQLWTYTVELQLRPRSAALQDAEGKQGSSPTLSSAPSPARYPPIDATATSDKKSHAKSEVAGHVLQKIRIYQLKYPALFQLSLPSTPDHSPVARPIPSPRFVERSLSYRPSRPESGTRVAPLRRASDPRAGSLAGYVSSRPRADSAPSQRRYSASASPGVWGR